MKDKWQHYLMTVSIASGLTHQVSRAILEVVYPIRILIKLCLLNVNVANVVTAPAVNSIIQSK